MGWASTSDLRTASSTRSARRADSAWSTARRGVATAIGASPFAPALAGIAFALAANPVADQLRVQSDYDQNLRLDPATGGAVNDGMLAFAKGDVNEG